MVFEQASAEIILYFIFYGVTGMAAAVAACYLMLRRGNAFAADVTPPMRLRCWAASFFAAAMLSYVWWGIFYVCSGEALSVAHVFMAVFDSVTLQTTIAGTLLAMLQDRKRSVRPFLLAMVPFVVLGVVLMVRPSVVLMHIALAYLLTVCALFTLYVIFAVRQYGRWLCDNYADLENKKVWLTQVLTIGIMLLFILYAFGDNNMTLSYVMMGTELVFFGLLLWRVETLPQLVLSPQAEQAPANAPSIDISGIEQLLAERCVATQLYLQHDLTLQQLAKTLGTNRYYLSRYFSTQGTTYNAYINDLRVRHFVSRYRETIRDGQPVTAKQLASDSGYRSYSTFSLAFKQRMGQSVTTWMADPVDSIPVNTSVDTRP